MNSQKPFSKRPHLELKIFRGSALRQRECHCLPSESCLSRPQNIRQLLTAPRIPCFRRDASTIVLAFASRLGAPNCDPCSSHMNPKIARPFNRLRRQRLRFEIHAAPQGRAVVYLSSSSRRLRSGCVQLGVFFLHMTRGVCQFGKGATDFFNLIVLNRFPSQI
jgi:hypothetical protein